jgi:hypothetical protein
LVWVGPADLRTSADLATLAWVLVLSRGRLRTVVALAVPGALITAVTIAFYATAP